MTFKADTDTFDVRAVISRATAAKRSACFIIIEGAETGRLYKLGGEEMLIGRSEEASICIDARGVSRHHARVVPGADGEVVLSDLGSKNGTYINGEPVEEKSLVDGDQVQIGGTTILKFSYQDSVEERFQRRQYESATRDWLTGCFNKRYLLERLPSEISFAKRKSKSLSLAMIDLDHFKKINDTHGHPAGDYVLKVVAKMMQSTLRSHDLLARYGGEEFALLMRETGTDGVLGTAERIRQRVEGTRLRYEGREIHTTVSIGVASLHDEDRESAEGLLELADKNLYRAKEGGRNRTVSPELTRE